MVDENTDILCKGITIFIIVIVGLNFFPVSVYGECEFWFAISKILLILGLLILSVVLFWGGGPTQHGILGFHYWNDPGATPTYLATGAAGGATAFWYTLVLAAFPFTFAPELIIATGGEMKSPRRNLPIAAKRYFYRLIIFYIGSVLAIGVICPYDDPRLSAGGAGAKSSAFVVGIERAGIHGLGSLVNAAIIISGWSSGNSFLYLSSRSLYSLAVAGNAPAVFRRCTKRGVPYVAVATSSLFTLLAYLNCGASSSTVFSWFVSLTNTSGFISWICCGIVYLRFRKACKVQGVRSPYRHWFQPYGAWAAIVGFVILALINGFPVFFSGQWNSSTFATAYIGIPIFLAVYFGHRIYHWRDPWAIKSEDVDLRTGLETVMAQEEPPKNSGKQGWWMQVKRVWE